MSAEPTDTIRCDALSLSACELLSCGKPYQRVRRNQRFCSPECKAASHDPDNMRQRGLVTSVRAIKGGKWSVTLHFDELPRLEKGKAAEVL